MFPEIGNILLILAFTLSSVCFLSTSYSYYSDTKFYDLQKSAYIIFFLLFVSFLLLEFAFLTDDFSVLYVANNSNPNLPDYYKFSALWGGHEGSLLLFVLILSFWMIAFSFMNNYSKIKDKNIVLSFFHLILSCLLGFIIFSSNPFERLLPIPSLSGTDLNPLLQDFAFTIHPPMLYLGYAGLVVPFSIALGRCLNVKEGWTSKIRNWTVFSWSFLTLGIALGSWWAYYELGWGGYWFWDPVENVALMPWLAATAFIHSLGVSIKSSQLRIWTILLSILVFSLSLFGAFIVRSGIIDSVHAFANDPDRGLYLLGFIGLIVFISVFLFILRLSSIQSLSRIKKFSKQSFISINNILFGALIFSVMLGVTYPLIYEFLFDQKISVGAPFYNAIFIPIVVLAAIFLFFSVDSKWSRSINFKFISAPISFSILFSLAFTLFVMQYFESQNISILASIFAGSLIIFRYIYEIINFIFSKKFINPFSVIAHMSLGLLLISISFNSLLSTERALSIDLNSTEAYKDLKISFKDIGVENNANYDSIKATFLVEDQTGRTFNLKPEKRRYFTRGQITTETAIHITFLRDIYITIGDQLDDGSWIVNIQINYLIRWIWLSALLMGLAGVILVFSNRVKT